MINIREVAKLAGVSSATVSRVINGTAKVSAEKRARVLEAITATDFVPNEVARSLYRKSAKLIGLIIYRHKPKTFREADDLIDRYIYFYNHERIQNKTGVTPLMLRHST